MFKSSFFTALAFGVSVIALVVSVFVAFQTKSVPAVTVVSRVVQPAVSVSPAVVSATPSAAVSISPTVQKTLPLRQTAPAVSVSPAVK